MSFLLFIPMILVLNFHYIREFFILFVNLLTFFLEEGVVVIYLLEAIEAGRFRYLSTFQGAEFPFTTKQVVQVFWMTVSSFFSLKHVLFKVTDVKITVIIDHATEAMSLTILEAPFVDGTNHDHSAKAMRLAHLI